MPSTEFLGRIRQLFKSDSDAHFDDIRRGLRTGRLTAPAQPMSDQELSRAIREFQAAEITDWTRQKLAKRLADAARSTAPRPR